MINNMPRPLSKIINNSTPAPTFSLSRDQIEALRTAAEVVLAVLAIAGIATVSVLAPNALLAVGKFFLKKGKRLTHSEKQATTARVFYYLKRTGLIKLKPDGRDFRLFLTQLGKKKLHRIGLNSQTVPKPNRWDGKWWQVAADIPTKDYRSAADLLRLKLKQMGFYSLQRTLWFYPYDPRRQLEYILNSYRIGRFATVMEINRMDKDDEIKMKRFFKEKRIL